MKYYFKAFRNYANFKGRASRKEYWYFVLFYSVFLFLTMPLDFICGTRIIEAMPLGVIYFTYAIVTTIPFLAVSVRRIHDSGKSGWIFFVLFIPIIGNLWYLYLMIIDGTQGVNKYGEVPE